jgi:quercetin dioxygenase-like cupin family protein
LNPIERVCSDLNAALDKLREEGFRLDSIYPADDPHTAVLSRDGQTVRLTTRAGPAPPSEMPPFEPEFVITRAGAGGGIGRAGMIYRDLIPGRLGGRYIASLITIPDAGPVADWVHYQRIALQLIFVRRGWVRVVYEDQGEPFVMQAGDLVLQPPLIRHRVIESSAGLEVVEISCPALHETVADHDMALPNGSIDAERDFTGQRFLRHVAAEARWSPFHGGQAQETGLSAATGGLAHARVLEPNAGNRMTIPAHDGELVFGFVVDGSAELNAQGMHSLGAGEAFVVPPGVPWSLGNLSRDFSLLHVTTARLEIRDRSPL